MKPAAQDRTISRTTAAEHATRAVNGIDQGLRILMVEQSIEFARLTVCLLNRSLPGCRIDIVGTLGAAIKVVWSRKPDAILLDLSLPDSQGLATFLQLHANAGSTPIVVLSACSDDNVAAAAVSAGAQDYLSKAQTTGPLLARAISHAVERRHFKELIDAIADGVIVVDAENRIQFLNRGARKLLRNVDGPLLGSECPFPVNPVVRRHHFVCRPELLVLEIQSIPTAWHGQSAQLICLRDVTKQHQLEEQLQYNSLHDELTGLPNRAFFETNLEAATARANRGRDYRFAILFGDLDRFKKVNDSLGHMAGDRLLKEVARRLTASLRPGDMVARFAGDQFVIFLDDLASTNHAIYVARRLQRLFVDPISVAQRDSVISLSIGIATSDIDYQSVQQIIRDADTAMNQAKQLGRGSISVFDQGMHQRAVTELRMEDDLRIALKQDQFTLAYQPLVELSSGGVVGCEALLRWEHPVRGLVSPAEFIPVAEECGLIVPMGSWVLEAACTRAASWSAAGRPLQISVNVSANQLRCADFVQTVSDILQLSGLDPARLTLEITERILVEDSEFVRDTLLNLKKLGVELHLDDFLTGYCSLSYVHKFPLDCLKIDRSFVRQLNEPGGGTLEIVRTIIDLAGNLGLSVVAEGIETSDELGLLRQMNCQFGQGYFFARPLQAQDFELLVASQARLTPVASEPMLLEG